MRSPGTAGWSRSASRSSSASAPISLSVLPISGLDPFVSLVAGALVVGVIAIPMSAFMLRLKNGEFAIGMWVIAALAHLLVNLDGLVRGETGTSLIALNAYATGIRRDIIYWLALASAALLLGALFALLRSRTGAAIQAIRDSEEAAASLGVRVMRTKAMLFVLSGFGAALAGTLWLATSITFQPNSYFGVQWTAYMIFMVLVGGLGTFEGPILGAVIFFAIETWFGSTGVWYLILLGATALVFALLLPRGLWGTVDRWSGFRLLPVGYRLIGGGAGPGLHRERTINNDGTGISVEVQPQTENSLKGGRTWTSEC